MEERIYFATSWVTDNDPERLRAASTDYPADILQTYLQLPQALPDRVRNLALDLTVAEPTPYDKAIALESYLRQFPYSLEVEKPPPGADVADYFLFEAKEGYCDYYATAMTVMARAIGLPARFVIGYASGYYDVEEAVYQITEAEAHSWTQIYFPGTGWVNFEPTAGRPAIDRESAPAGRAGPASPAPAGSALEEDELANEAGWPTFRLDDLTRVHPFWWGLLALLALFIVANIDFWRLRLLQPAALTEALYQRLVARAVQTGLPAQPGDTPYEFARNFVTYIHQEIPKSRLARFRVSAFWRPVIYPVDEPTFRGVHQLAHIFVHQKYAPPDKFSYDKDDLLVIWEELEPELTRAARILSLTRRYPKLLSRQNGAMRPGDPHDAAQ